MAQIINNIDKEIIDYGIKMLDVISQWQDTKGEGINVAVLDTGIDYNHYDLVNRVKGGFNFTTANPGDYIDRNGHGTFCAGIIGATDNEKGTIGVAPEANIYAVKVLNDQGKGDLNWLADGIEWSIANNIHIISMSLGFQSDFIRIKEAVQKAYKAGIIMVAAAGNDASRTQVDFPARYPEVIGVTAIDANQKLGSFCTTGTDIEFSAPGVDVISTYLNNQFAVMSGTSMATPHISGAIALLQAKAKKIYNRFLTFEEIRLILDMNTKDLGIKGKDIQYGYGVFKF